MAGESNQENARGLAIAAFVIICIWALPTAAIGIVYSATAHSTSGFDGGLDATSSPDGLAFFLGILLFIVWLATLNGMIGAAVMGSIAIRRARAGWQRMLAYLGVLVGGVALAIWWGFHDLATADGPPADRARMISGIGLILTAVAVVAVQRWLLKPALRRPEAMPPPDPRTLLYSDSTT